MRRCDYEDSSEDELVESFSSLSLQKGRAQKGRAQGHGSAAVKHSGRRFPEYEKELKSRPLSSARKASPPETGPCARASNGTIRRHLGLVGDPSADIDHLYEGHKARARGLYPEIEANKEVAPMSLNRRWGGMYQRREYKELEAEKRAYYGNPRYDEAHEAMNYCNKKYNYPKKK